MTFVIFSLILIQILDDYVKEKSVLD